MRASFGKTCKEYASQAVNGLLLLSVTMSVSLTLGSPVAAAATVRLQAPPGLHLHTPTTQTYPSLHGQKPDARFVAAVPLAEVTAAAPLYQVASGDTLSGIAASHLGNATDWQGLCAANAIDNCNLIYVDQTIKLTAAYTASAPVAPVHAAAPAPAPAPRPVVHVAPPAPPAAPVYHATGGTWEQDTVIVFGSGGAGCADAIIDRESGGDPTIHNGGGHGYEPYLAYGIPQALPGSKMAAAGSDWLWNPLTQIRWMKMYVDATYGGICNAWGFWQVHHAY